MPDEVKTSPHFIVFKTSPRRLHRCSKRLFEGSLMACIDRPPFGEGHILPRLRPGTMPGEASLTLAMRVVQQCLPMPPGALDFERTLSAHLSGFLLDECLLVASWWQEGRLVCRAADLDVANSLQVSLGQ